MLVITLYERIRVALESFFLAFESQCPEIWPSNLKVTTAETPEACSGMNADPFTSATPGQCSGFNVDAAIFLPAHRRYRKESKWWSGHMAQGSRRYVGNSRAGKLLYILAEQPPSDVKPVDEYWLRAAGAFKAEPMALCSAKVMHFLEWPEGNAETIFSKAEVVFDNVEWSTHANKLCPLGASESVDVSADHFFTSRAQMERARTT